MDRQTKQLPRNVIIIEPIKMFQSDKWRPHVTQVAIDFPSETMLLCFYIPLLPPKIVIFIKKWTSYIHPVVDSTFCVLLFNMMLNALLRCHFFYRVLIFTWLKIEGKSIITVNCTTTTTTIALHPNQHRTKCNLLEVIFCHVKTYLHSH